MRSYLFTFLSIWLMPLCGQAQDKLSCADLKQGIFHYYRDGSSVHVYCLRKNDLEYVNENANTDTTVWQINWTGPCSYTEKYLSGSHTMDAKTAAFLNKHLLAYNIINITDDYYVAREHLNKVTGLYMETDTMWFHERQNVTDNELFKQLPLGDLLRAPISDTSQYAIVYVYRPGKIFDCLVDYPIYFDNRLMCIVRNRSGYIFKIRKEGKFTIDSRLYKDIGAAPLDVQFGKTYYVRSTLHWGLSNAVKDYKLKMTPVDAITGKTEFEAVKLR